MPSHFPESAPYKPSCSSSVRLARYTGSLDSGPCPADGQTWVVLGDVHGRVRRISDIPELEKAAGDWPFVLVLRHRAGRIPACHRRQ